MKQLRSLIFVVVNLVVASCQNNSPSNYSSSVQGTSPHSVARAAEDKKSEQNFRDIFATLLTESGVSDKEIAQAVFYTPDKLLVPQTKTGAGKISNLKIIDDHFLSHTPEDVYSHGLCNPPQTKNKVLKPGNRPITLIVFPGFTSEFITFDPFEEVLANQESIFAKKMRPILENLTDSVYQVRDQKNITVKMSEVMRVGSFDRKGLPWVNIIMLTPKLGSLESLGKIRPLMENYARRLHKILHNRRGVDSLGDIYVLGFSRGAAVGLDFLSYMNEKPVGEYPWFQRVKGLVSLGGVLYGAQAPDRALSGDDSPDAKTVKILRKFITDLQSEPPEGLSGQAYAREVAARVSKNMATWTQLIKDLNVAGGDPSQKTKGSILLAQEEALRHQDHFPEKAGILANFETFKSILFDLLTMQCPVQCYFQNIRAFKQILGSFLLGVDELTTATRLRWWDEAKLPPKFRILSITATMPGPPAGNQLSPLLASPYIGYRSPDFVSRLRPGYYSCLDSGAGPLNDSAISVARARYWPQLDSVSGRRHDYLGILGAHHYGLAFPYAVADKNRNPNSFPRALLLGAIGSYLREFP